MERIVAEDVVAADSVGLDLGALVRGLAHDIANPLNAISMNAELAKLLLDRDQTARAREVIDRLVEDCARCGRLIQGFQRFGSGLHAHPRETIPVRALVDGAIKLAREERMAGMPEIHIEGIDAQVCVDRPALERAIAGLLHNAKEAGAESVGIQLHGDGDWVVIDIRDDGAGIAPESLDKVVEPFYSTRRSEGGSGLGLTLALELFRTQGGRLAISANTPRGVWIELRLQVACGQKAAPGGNVQV